MGNDLLLVNQLGIPGELIVQLRVGIRACKVSAQGLPTAPIAHVPVWNALPEPVALSPSYCSFKTRLCFCYDILIAFCTFARNL